MSLSKDEIEQLTSIVETNRRHVPTPDPVTDESVVLVAQPRHPEFAYHAYSAGKPACVRWEEKEYQTMSSEEAQEWHFPCGACYPEGDDS